MIAKKLTDRQQAVLDFMRWHLVEYQRLPTIREIGFELGIRSPNGVICHLKALIRRGLVSRWDRARAMNYRLNGVRIRLEPAMADSIDRESSRPLSRRSAATDEEIMTEIADAFHDTTCASS